LGSYQQRNENIMKTSPLRAVAGLIAILACSLIQVTAQPIATNATGQLNNAFVLNLSGFDVRDTTGVPAGRLEAVVVDPSGSIEMAVLGVGNRLVPVPWQLVTMSTDPRATRTGQNALLTVNVDHARLLQAPAFDRNRWPDLTQPTWSQQFFTFFGLQPPRVAGAMGTNIFGNNLTNLFPTGRTNLVPGLTNLLLNTNLGPGRTGLIPPGPPQAVPPPAIPSQPAPPAGTPPAPPVPVQPAPAIPPR
jgi:hypothetical protein